MEKDFDAALNEWFLGPRGHFNDKASRAVPGAPAAEIDREFRNNQAIKLEF